MRYDLEKLSILDTATLKDALVAIDAQALGVAAICRADHTFLGLLTDGDIRRALIKGYGLETLISHIPRPETTCGYTWETMEQWLSKGSSKIRHMPILDDQNKLVDLIVLPKGGFIPVANPQLGSKELENITECIMSGWISSTGRFVSQFEEDFARFSDSTYAVSCSNGTTALHLALLALDVQAGDEVLLPSLTFIATANAVRYMGAHPVLCDVDPANWTICPRDIERKITAKTKGIIPVHLYGHPADMDAINEIARAHGLWVVEDAAEAHGTKYKGKSVGALGDIGAFSFFGNKTLTTGEGGMLCTHREDLAQKMRILRDHGMDPQRRYYHIELGYNYRITNMQAAIGCAQIERAAEIIQKKRQIAAWYGQELGYVDAIQLPIEETWATNTFWLYSIVINPVKVRKSIQEIITFLRQQQIDSRPFFPLIQNQPIYAIEFADIQTPVAQKLSHEGLSLPSFPTLEHADIIRISAALKSIVS